MGREASRDQSRSRDDGRSRSRSHSCKDSRRPSRGGRVKKPDDYGVDTMKITDDDAAFILGKGGKTKEKIARVSEAEIALFERDLILEFRAARCSAAEQGSTPRASWRSALAE